MAKNFNELRRKMSPEAQERSRREAEQLIAEMALDELREAQKMTQEHLAKLLGVNQSAISKMERRTDMYISTLQAIIEAMGGRLQIQAVFPGGKVEITQFAKLRKAS
jgi:transcriptional regulator with XRE-family HTH domain